MCWTFPKCTSYILRGRCQLLYQKVSLIFLGMRIRLRYWQWQCLNLTWRWHLCFLGCREGWAWVKTSTVSQAFKAGRLVSRGGLHWFSVPHHGAILTVRNQPGVSSCLTTVNSRTPTVQGKPCLLSRTCKYSSSLSGSVHGACGEASSALHAMALLQVHQGKTLKDLHQSGHDPVVLKKLWAANDLSLCTTKFTAHSLGRPMSTLKVQERHL